MNSVFSIKIAFLQSSPETNKIKPHQKWVKATGEHHGLHKTLETMPLRSTR